MDVLPWQDAAAACGNSRNARGNFVAICDRPGARGGRAHCRGCACGSPTRLTTREQARTLAREDTLSLDDLVAHLRRVGYESHDMVEMPGQFTVRGGIVDIFPAEAERPVRLELFGDSVESLREFDPEHAALGTPDRARDASAAPGAIREWFSAGASGIRGRRGKDCPAGALPVRFA